MKRFKTLPILFVTFALANAVMVAAQAGERKGTPAKGPNFLVDASAALFDAVVKRQIDQTEQVRDVFQGAPVAGTGRTLGLVTAELVPDARKAIIEVVFRGQSTAQTVTTRPFVFVHTSSITPLEVRRRVVVDGSGIVSLPGPNFGKSTITLGRITGRRGDPDALTALVAGQLFNRTRGDAEQDTAKKTCWQTSKRIGDELAPTLTLASKVTTQGFADLKRAGLAIETLEFSTSSAALHARLRFATPGKDISPTPPLSPGIDLALRMHQSMLNQALQAEFGGKTISLNDAQKFYDDLTQGFVKDGGKNGEKQDGFKNVTKLFGMNGTTTLATFAEKDPIYVNFTEQGFNFELDIVSVQQGKLTYEGMRVKTEYGIENSKAGVHLVRKGAVQFLPTSATAKKLPALPLSFTVIRDVLFAEVLKERFTMGPVPIPGLAARMNFSPPSAGARDGWIGLAWRLAP